MKLEEAEKRDHATVLTIIVRNEQLETDLIQCDKIQGLIESETTAFVFLHICDSSVFVGKLVTLNESVCERDAVRHATNRFRGEGVSSIL